jgi:hypothetical protein
VNHGRRCRILETSNIIVPAAVVGVESFDTVPLILEGVTQNDGG